MEKGNKETLANETNEALQPVQISFKGQDTVYEFTNVFLNGRMADGEESEISTILSGFTTVEEFLTTYSSMILQSYEFLKDNLDLSEEVIIDSLKSTTESIFAGIENDEYEEYFNEVRELG